MWCNWIFRLSNDRVLYTNFIALIWNTYLANNMSHQVTSSEASPQGSSLVDGDAPPWDRSWRCSPISSSTSNRVSLVDVFVRRWLLCCVIFQKQLTASCVVTDEHFIWSWIGYWLPGTLLFSATVLNLLHVQSHSYCVLLLYCAWCNLPMQAGSRSQNDHLCCVKTLQL